MQLLSLIALAGAAAAQTVNRTATNGWGSTPSQRRHINATQAMTAIEAAVDQSNVIG